MKFNHSLRSTVALAAALAAGYLMIFPVSPARAGKHPEPSLYPLPNAWYFTFKHGMPRRIVVDVPGLKVPTAYWYLSYTVTNNSGKEADFLPDFEMVTEDGKIRPSDRNIPLPVFDAIKKVLGNDLLVSPTQVAGPLHQGEDQAKDSVAIWEEPSARMGTFSIYVGGLNSEFIHATDNDGKPVPVLDKDGNPVLDAAGKPVPITLRKTLELDYVIYGDEIAPEKDEVHFKGETWLMR